MEGTRLGVSFVNKDEDLQSKVRPKSYYNPVLGGQRGVRRLRKDGSCEMTVKSGCLDENR